MDYAVGEQIALALACGRVFGWESPCPFRQAWAPSRFSLRFSYFHRVFCRIEKARLRRWALCALRTPRSQAERALHRTSQKAAVRASVLVCATSRGCRWVVSSAHPARRQLAPWLLCPVSHRTHGTWLVPAALTSARTCTHIHTGPLGTAGLVLFVASGALLVRRCPMRPACWRLQSPALLTARFPRILRAPWSLHRLRARSRACRLCGSPTTPHNRPERPDWRIASAAGLSHTEAKWLSLWAVGSRQASCGAWEGTATPTGPWTPLFRRGARSRRRCACLPRPCCGQICPPSSHPHLCNTPQTAPVCPPSHPVPLGCVGAAETG